MGTKTKNEKVTPLHFGEHVTLTENETSDVRDVLATFASDAGRTVEFAEAVASRGSSKTAQGRKATALGRVYSAVGVHAAIQSGVIGDGGLSLKAYGERYGHSPSNMTALKCLGLAVSKGFTPAFPEWPILSDKAGNKAMREAVEKAKDGKGIATAVQNLTAKRAAARPDDGTKAADPETGQSGPEVDTLTPFEAAKAAVGTLRETLPTLDAEQFAVVEDMLTNVLATAITDKVAKVA